MMTIKTSLALIATTLLLFSCTQETTTPVRIDSAASDIPELPRMADGSPNMNGIWQTMNEANWNIEAHSAQQGPVFALGAQFSVPPGFGVINGDVVPYLPDALDQRNTNFTNRLNDDPEIKCFMPGVPRSTYLPYPFQIIQSDSDMLIAYQFAGAVRQINMGAPTDAIIPSWMGWNNGRWDDDTLVIEVTGLNGNWLDRTGNYYSGNARVTERYTLSDANTIHYEATIEDDSVFSEPLTISMPLYRRQDANMQLLEYKCPEFAEEAMYGDLRKEPMEDTLH